MNIFWWYRKVDLSLKGNSLENFSRETNIKWVGPFKIVAICRVVEIHKYISYTVLQLFDAKLLNPLCLIVHILTRYVSGARTQMVCWVKHFFMGKADCVFSELFISLISTISKIIINLYRITSFCVLNKQEVKNKNKNNSDMTTKHNHFLKTGHFYNKKQRKAS